MAPHCGFNLHLSDGYWCWASFHMPLGPLYVFLGEVSVQVLCLFLNWVICLPGVELCEFFIYFGDQTLVRGIIGKYVFPYSWFSFHFTAVFFSRTEAFYFDEVLFFLFFPKYPLLQGTRLWGCCCMECLTFSCQCFPLGLLSERWKLKPQWGTISHRPEWPT